MSTPAGATFVEFVTSAAVSIPLNLVLSAAVIIAPLPTLDTSDKSVTDDVG